MRASAVVLIVITLAALIAAPAASQQIWQEQRITNTTWPEGQPRIWGDTIYYGDGRNGYGEIYAWDQAQGARLLLGGDGISRGVLAVYQDKLVTYRYVNGQYDLYTWDPVNGEVPLCTAPGNQTNARIYGDTIVWEDRRAGAARIYAWDPVNGERQLFPTSGGQMNPRIWGDRIIWYDDGNYGSYPGGIYTWTPQEGAIRIGDGDSAAVYQDRVVIWWSAWTEQRPHNEPLHHPGYLYEWTPAMGLRMLAQHSYDETFNVETWGDLVIYGNSRVGAWDPVRGFSPIVNNSVTSLSVYGNKVAWASGGDIYLSTLVPEPSSMLALIGGMGVLGTMLRRRKQ